MTTRTDIRSALKTIIEGVEGITTVYLGRRRSIPETALPAACIYVESENKEPDTLNSGEYTRTLTLVTEIHVQANSAEAAETLLDTLCDRRETAIAADETLGGLVERIDFDADEYTAEEDARRPAAVAVCRDSALYTA